MPPTSLQAGRLLVRYGNEMALQRSDFEAASEALQKALEISRREKDVALEMRTLTSMASAYGWQLRFSEALDSSLAAIELANECNELYAEALAHMWAVSSFVRSWRARQSKVTCEGWTRTLREATQSLDAGELA